jgi:hypothetical protein
MVVLIVAACTTNAAGMLRDPFYLVAGARNAAGTLVGPWIMWLRVHTQPMQACWGGALECFMSRTGPLLGALSCIYVYPGRCPEELLQPNRCWHVHGMHGHGTFPPWHAHWGHDCCSHGSSFSGLVGWLVACVSLTLRVCLAVCMLLRLVCKVRGLCPPNTQGALQH